MAGYNAHMTYREPPEPPDLTPAAVAAVARAKDIERRLLAAMARGEQPTPAVLAEALHAGATLLLLAMETHERAELLYAAIIAAENRRAGQ